jgi:hypothetical protein
MLLLQLTAIICITATYVTCTDAANTNINSNITVTSTGSTASAAVVSGRRAIVL